ncbi:hypothetical protein DFH07DRAFT_1059983 [Mycena maculata]|uniref:RanBP2-type domain-containing protein n=1 Tax=Mycena maculata TaxID=230809 RepID=A0AAD7NGZ8_9AGAR|nr:hypothetical protein DFH07DRAFT_1059983 [Mycena maculata]
MAMRTSPTSLEFFSASGDSLCPRPRVLHREWKAIKPYLPKSTSLPEFQMLPRDRPRFTCLGCGFVNFYNIPICVWCAIEAPESSVRAFESTMPRIRTASAPPRVFWELNDLSLRSDTKKIHGNRTSTLWRRYFCETPKTRDFARSNLKDTSSVSTDGHSGSTRRPQSMMAQTLYLPHGSGMGRRPTHKRSHSQPNALRIGHTSRPYYSVIRKDTSYHPTSVARSCESVAPHAHRPASIALPGPLHSTVAPSDEAETDIEQDMFMFVSSQPPFSDESRTHHRSLSARISRRFASPVVALYSRTREAEMREALAALVRQPIGVEQGSDPRLHQDGLVAAQLRKLRRGLKGLVRRTTAD